MTTEPAPREPQLTGQTVLVLGGSSGIGLETARRARAEGAEVVITGRNTERLAAAAADIDFAEGRRAMDEHVWLPLRLGQHAVTAVRPGGSLTFVTGSVDTPLSASLLGGELEKRREQLRAKLPIGRVVEPEDLAALAVFLMTNTAVTGSTYDIDGGGQVVGI